jgi:hypothetical protein
VRKKSNSQPVPGTACYLSGSEFFISIGHIFSFFASLCVNILLQNSVAICIKKRPGDKGKCRFDALKKLKKTLPSCKNILQCGIREFLRSQNF